MSHRRRLFPTLICFALATGGLTFTSISPMLPQFSSVYSVDTATIGLLLSCNSLGFVCLTILCGTLADRIGAHRVLAVSLLGLGGCCIALPLSRSFGLTCMLMTLMGGCMGLSQSLGLAAGARCSARKERFVHIGMMFYGIGALAGPVLVSLMMQLGFDWGLYFDAVGGLLLVEGFVSLTMRFDTAAGKDKPMENQIRLLLKNRPFLLACLCMALYCGAEVGSWGLLSTYLQDRGFTQLFSGLAVGVFWCGIIFGRGISGWLSSILPASKLIRWLSLASALISIVAFVNDTQWVILLCIALLGVSLAGIWPSIASLAGALAGTASIAAYPLTIAAGGAGSAAAPYLQGVLGSSLGFTSVMLLPAILLLIVIAFMKTRQLGG